nr:MAG TPA: hypothetical protein [Caudoviricetes sp.]
MPARRWRYEPLWGDLGVWVVPTYGWALERPSDWLPRPLVRGGACVHIRARAWVCVSDAGV